MAKADILARNNGCVKAAGVETAMRIAPAVRRRGRRRAELGGGSWHEMAVEGRGLRRCSGLRWMLLR